MRFALRGTVAILATLALLAAAPAPANAYDRDAAVRYANVYWKNYNSNYKSFSSDCTNFMSQSVRYGGILASASSTWEPYTFAWVNADGLYRQSKTYWATSIWKKTDSWAAANKYTPSGHRGGDLVFYDFNADGKMDHGGIMVEVATDPGYPSFTGNTINQHTTNRQHAQWHLRAYNSQRATTSYYLVAISNNS